MALDLDFAVAVFDLDFGEVVLGQQLGELADQIGVDPHAAVFRVAVFLGFARDGFRRSGHLHSPTETY